MTKATCAKCNYLLTVLTYIPIQLHRFSELNYVNLTTELFSNNTKLIQKLANG